MVNRRLIALTLLAMLLGSLLLSACDGMARLDIDVDPETGEGTIDIIGGGDGNGDESDTNGDDSEGEAEDSGVQDAIIFATVVVLLLGVTAIILSLANRPRGQE